MKKLVTPQRVYISELENDLHDAWQKGTLEQFIELIPQKSSLDKVEARKLAAKLIEEGKMAYDPEGWLVWVR